jgi:elongation factor G
VPAEFQGDVLGDLSSRRGRVQGTRSETDGKQTVTALVPTAELAHYAIDLRAMSAGRGQVRTEHDHYDLAPPGVVAPPVDR